MAEDELVTLRRFVQDESLFLVNISYNVEKNLAKKAYEDPQGFTLDYVLQEFHKLQKNIISTRKHAELLTKNWFDILPLDMVELVVSFLPISALGRMATVSKRVNSIMSKDKIWKSACITLWNDCPELRDILQKTNIHPLIWIQDQLISFNNMYSWKWFGKCFKSCGKLSWICKPINFQTILNMGPIKDGQLVGMGVRAIFASPRFFVTAGRFWNDRINGYGLRFYDDGTCYTVSTSNVECNLFRGSLLQVVLKGRELSSTMAFNTLDTGKKAQRTERGPLCGLMEHKPQACGKIMQ